MPPDGRQQDEVKRQAEAAHLGQLRQAIGQPVDARRWVQRARMRAHGVGGFDGDDVIATLCEPRGVAAGTCANIEDRGAWRGEQIEKRLVDFFECKRFVLVDQLVCVLLVVENGRHQARW
jgi:hypothetical protein